MRPHTETGIAVHGMGPTEDFKFKVTGKAFSIFIDKLYSNKLGAVVREVASNCIDSHRSAGKLDTPYIITIPSRDDDYLTFEDFGLGLSPDLTVQRRRFWCTRHQPASRPSLTLRFCLRPNRMGYWSPSRYPMTWPHLSRTKFVHSLAIWMVPDQ